MSINIRVCPGRNNRAAAVIADLLDAQPDFHVLRCSDCATGLRRREPDAVVTVTGLAGTDDIAGMKGLRRQHPQACLIVLSLCDDRTFRAAMLEAGADQYVLLDDAVPTLLTTVRDCIPQPRRSRLSFPVASRRQAAM